MSDKRWSDFVEQCKDEVKTVRERWPQEPLALVWRVGIGFKTTWFSHATMDKLPEPISAEDAGLPQKQFTFLHIPVLVDALMPSEGCELMSPIE